MKPVYFFLGANSGEGFYSLYDQMLNGRFDDLLILKGGPGCGKSTFMRRMGEAMERAGERVVYINCSGDPDSLDGAIFLDRNTAVVDGTSPHGMAPLGHFCGTGIAIPAGHDRIEVWRLTVCIC